MPSCSHPGCSCQLAPPEPASEPEEESSFWRLAREAQAETDKWPEWKRRAADMALVTRPLPMAEAVKRAVETGEPQRVQNGVVSVPQDERAVVDDDVNGNAVPPCKSCGAQTLATALGADVCIDCATRDIDAPQAAPPSEPAECRACGAPQARPKECRSPCEWPDCDCVHNFDAPAPPAAPEEDRTVPPPGYLVWNAGRANPPVGTPCTGWNAGTTLPEIHRTERQAVAACWAHHDAITAPLRARAEAAERERSVIEYAYEELCGEAHTLRARVAELEREARDVADRYFAERDGLVAHRDRVVAERDAISSDYGDLVKTHHEECGRRIAERDTTIARAEQAEADYEQCATELEAMEQRLIAEQQANTQLRALLAQCEPVVLSAWTRAEIADAGERSASAAPLRTLLTHIRRALGNNT